MKTRGAVVRVLQEGSLYVLLFLLPFAPAAVEIMFGVLLVGWIRDRLDPDTRAESVWPRPQSRALALAIVGYLAVCALSIIASDYPWKSVQGLVKKWMQYLLLCVIASDLGSRPRVMGRALVVLAFSSVFVIIEGITQEVFKKGVFRGHTLSIYGRMTGPYENPGDLATYFMVLIPVLLAYSMTQRGLRRSLLWSLLLLLLMCLGRTITLGAWMGLFMGLITVLSMDVTFRRWGLILLPVMALLAGIFLQSAGVLHLTFSMSAVGKVDRLAMWQSAIGMIRDRPLLGHGLNTFMANYLKYWVGGERTPRYAHNCYLQVAAETGIVGLLAFLGLLGCLFTRLVGGLSRIRSDDRLILLGCIAGLLAFAIQAGVDTNFYSLRQAALFWTLAGLSLGLSERNASEGAVR